MQWLQDKNKKSDVIVGIEPTGHYWFDLGDYLEDEGIFLVMVNPYAVKQTKKLDDNSQRKNYNKDPKVIAKLVIERRYTAPYTLDGVYADLRIMVANRKRLIREFPQIINQIVFWLLMIWEKLLKCMRKSMKELCWEIIYMFMGFVKIVLLQIKVL